MSRIGRFFSDIHPKVIVSSLASSLSTAFAPMVPSLLQHGVVTVGRGQLGLAALVGFLTFLGGWIKSGPKSPITTTAEGLVKQVLDALPPVPASPSFDDLVKTVKGAVLTDVRQQASALASTLIAKPPAPVVLPTPVPEPVVVEPAVPVAPPVAP